MSEKKQASNQPESKGENSGEIVDRVPKELEPVLKDLPEPKRQAILKALKSISIHQQTFSGPLPPPNILKNYSDVVRDGAERIMSMAEKQSAHRIVLEDHAIREELRQSGRGQVFGFILGFVGLGLATLLAILGHEVIAGIFGTTTIVGLVAVFVIGKKSQEQTDQ
jgi:uncharacterized membrane protein